MKIGCNYSPALLDLLEKGKIEIDYIKLSLYPGLEEGFEPGIFGLPVLVHGINPPGPERLGAEVHPELDWGRLNRIVFELGSPHLGVHLAVNGDDIVGKLDQKKTREKLIKGAQAWNDGLEVPLLGENVPDSPYYQKKGVLPWAGDPWLIDEVCREAGIGLLLDLAHARVSAWTRGMEIKEYLSVLPLDLVGEIHLAAPLMTQKNGLRDRHLELEKIDYNLFEWVLGKCSPEIVTLEYGGPGEHFSWRSDPEAIIRQIERIGEIVKMAGFE